MPRPRLRPRSKTRNGTRLAATLARLNGDWRKQLHTIAHADGPECPPCMAEFAVFSQQVHCAWCPSADSTKDVYGAKIACTVPCRRAANNIAQDKFCAVWMLTLNHGDFSPKIPAVDAADQCLSRFWNACAKLVLALSQEEALVSDAESGRQRVKKKNRKKNVASRAWLGNKCNGECEKRAVMSYVFAVYERAAKV